MGRRSLRGQSIVEYLLVFGVVAAAITGMMVYAKRGVQAGLKAAADDLTPFPGDAQKAQIEGMRQEAGDVRDTQGRMMAGMRVAADSSMVTTQDSNIDTGLTGGGGYVTTYNADGSQTQGTSSSKVVTELK